MIFQRNPFRGAFASIRSGHVLFPPVAGGTRSASVWPSPRQTPGPSRPYSPDRLPPDTNTKHASDISAWSNAPRILTRQKPMGGVLRIECARRSVFGAPVNHPNETIICRRGRMATVHFARRRCRKQSQVLFRSFGYRPSPRWPTVK